MADLHGLGPCARCGTNPSRGWSQIGDNWYCHPDEGQSCYVAANADQYPVDAWQFIIHPPVNETKETPMSPPVTCADKLRDLNDAAWSLLPEIAAVIEAAERVWDPKQSDGCHCRYDVPDKITDPLLIKVECEPCAAYRLLADALAALSARLDGAT